MALFHSQKRQVPKPELIGPHQSTNPMFEAPPDWSSFRSRVVGYTAAGLFLTALAWLVYGPWFAVQAVTVSGTRLLDPASIKASAERYLDGQRWLILPNRTLWIVSSHGLSQHLERQIRQRISVEEVRVEKIRPHDIKIIVAERTPVATWTNGTIFGSVDKQGKIIEMTTTTNPDLPIIRDENQTAFTVDSSVVKQEVITAIQNLAGKMQVANIKVKEYLIPVPVCPAPIITTPETNTNSAVSNSNTVSINQNRNTNSSTTNANVAVSILPPCDREALRYGSQEVHAQLDEGPRVLFDRHGDLGQAVQALQRVLAERANKTYTSIDVRFGDRVYVK